MTTENQPARMGDDAVALLRCPFCGGDRLKIEAHGYGHFGAMCDASEGGCGAESGHYPTPSAAALAWNTRNTDASPVPDGVSDRSEFCNEHGMFHSVEMRSPDCTFDSDARELYAHGGDGGGVKRWPSAEFEEWFAGIEAGDGTIPVPQSIADGDAWHEHIGRRQIALGAWTAALATQQPASGEDDEVEWDGGAVDWIDMVTGRQPYTTTPATAAHVGSGEVLHGEYHSRRGPELWIERWDNGKFVSAIRDKEAKFPPTSASDAEVEAVGEVTGFGQAVLYALKNLPTGTKLFTRSPARVGGVDPLAGLNYGLLFNAIGAATSSNGMNQAIRASGLGIDISVKAFKDYITAALTQQASP